MRRSVDEIGRALEHILHERVADTKRDMERNIATLPAFQSFTDHLRMTRVAKEVLCQRITNAAFSGQPLAPIIQAAIDQYRPRKDR